LVAFFKYEIIIIKHTKGNETMSDLNAYTYLNQPVLHLIYASASLPTPSQATLSERILLAADQMENTLAIKWTQQDTQRCLGQAVFGHHSFHIAGLAMPLPPDVTDRTIMISPWQAQIKAAMRQHSAHLSLVYASGDPDPIEQMVALYSLAHAFENEDLLGIVNEPAWTAHPPADFLSEKRIVSYRHEIPFNLWIGYVRFYTDSDSYWLTTKGHHLFDIPDLAYHIQPGGNPDVIIHLFINVFYYLYEQDVEVTAGDTLEITSSGQQLQFSEVTELPDLLMGPSGTLVITQANNPT
jgi:hypothetical protein